MNGTLYIYIYPMIKMLLARLASFNRLLFTTGRIYKVRSEMSFVLMKDCSRTDVLVNETLYFRIILRKKISFKKKNLLI